MARAFLKPARSGLASAREAIGDATSAPRAWERLLATGRVPPSWRSDPARVFVADDEAIRDPAFGPFGSEPPTVESCALVAADVDGMRRAERAAEALATCLAPWGAPTFTRVAWWTLSRERYDYAVTDTRPGVIYAPLFALGLLASQPEADVLRTHSPFGRASEVAAAWSALARRRAPIVVPATSLARPRAATSAPSFADIPDPTAPLAAIEEEGYATLEYLGRDGTVLLVLPRD